jgi:hypothetical protein
MMQIGISLHNNWGIGDRPDYQPATPLTYVAAHTQRVGLGT